MIFVVKQRKLNLSFSRHAAHNHSSFIGRPLQNKTSTQPMVLLGNNHYRYLIYGINAQSVQRTALSYSKKQNHCLCFVPDITTKLHVFCLHMSPHHGFFSRYEGSYSNKRTQVEVVTIVAFLFGAMQTALCRSTTQLWTSQNLDRFGCKRSSFFWSQGECCCRCCWTMSSSSSCEHCSHQRVSRWVVIEPSVVFVSCYSTSGNAQSLLV